LVVAVVDEDVELTELVDRALDELPTLLGDNVVEWGSRVAEAEGTTFGEWLARKSEAEFATGTMPVPDDVAGVALFLASEMSRTVTGQLLSANNGQWVEGNQ
jgi:NAD(P)-dependent dehydrogenase (short-subunit alcohol dehydrogenase family)